MRARGLRVGARLGLALALLAVLLWWADPTQVAEHLAGAQARWLGAAFALSLSANVASALRWRALARWLGAAVSAPWALRTYFEAAALNTLLPGAVVGGDLYRIHALTRAPLPLAEATLSVLIDRVGGLWLLLVLGLGAASWGLAGGAIAPALDARGAALLPAGLPAWLPLALAGLLAALPLVLLRWTRRGVPRPPPPAERWHQRLRALARRPQAEAEYGRQVLWSSAVQILSIGALAAGGAAIGLQLPWWIYAVAAVPAFVLAALPVSFGGWGTREAGAVVAFGAFGVAPPQAIAVALLYGVWALCQGLLGALLWLGWGRASRSRLL